MSLEYCFNCRLYNRQEIIKCGWNPTTAATSPLEGCRDWEPVVLEEPLPLPVVLEEPLPLTIVVEEPLPLPIVVEEPLPLPIVVEEPLPVVANWVVVTIAFLISIVTVTVTINQLGLVPLDTVQQRTY